MRHPPELPASEIDFLNSLAISHRDSRLAVLHEAGWSFAVLAKALNKPKTTIHFWTKHAIKDPTMSLNPIPDIRPRLRELSLLSRRYRARTPYNSPIAVANREMTSLAVNLYAKGVPTADIANAAGVSYRAMARRIASGIADNITAA
jgi:hypothetical protein